MTLTLKTAAELVYEELRARIVSLELAPGAGLPLAELATRYGVSTMPVRSALLSLEGEGLVRQLRHRGAVVAPLELEDLEVIQAVRVGIECFAAREGAPVLSDGQVDEIDRLFERCRTIAPEHTIDRYLHAQWELQNVCYAAAGRPRLLALITQYRRRAERYLRLAVGGREVAQNLPVHERFVAACHARDGTTAEAVLREAFAWTVETLRPQLAGAGGTGEARESA